jgi:hypothetical protein
MQLSTLKRAIISGVENAVARPTRRRFDHLKQSVQMTIAARRLSARDRRQSGLFDAAWYLKQAPDAALAGTRQLGRGVSQQSPCLSLVSGLRSAAARV